MLRDRTTLPPFARILRNDVRLISVKQRCWLDFEPLPLPCRLLLVSRWPVTLQG
jgi:hypothetical protein